MKNTLMFLLVSLLLAFSLTACGGGNQTGMGSQTNGGAGEPNGSVTDGATDSATDNMTGSGEVNGNVPGNAANNGTANNGAAGDGTVNNGAADNGGSLVGGVEDALDDAGRAVRNAADGAMRDF